MLPRLDQLKDGDYVFEILEQRNVMILLESVKTSPKTVQQLAMECKIPRSTAYRTMGKIARLEFVKTKYVFNNSGKWEKTYRYNEFFIEDVKNKKFGRSFVTPS